MNFRFLKGCRAPRNLKLNLNAPGWGWGGRGLVIVVPSQEARSPAGGKSSYLALRNSASGPEIELPGRNFCRIIIRKASESALRPGECLSEGLF